MKYCLTAKYLFISSLSFLRRIHVKCDGNLSKKLNKVYVSVVHVRHQGQVIAEKYKKTLIQSYDIIKHITIRIIQNKTYTTDVMLVTRYTLIILSKNSK